jgi:hypothetical protein
MGSDTCRHDIEYSCSIKMENFLLVQLLLVFEESLCSVELAGHLI